MDAHRHFDISRKQSHLHSFNRISAVFVVLAVLLGGVSAFAVMPPETEQKLPANTPAIHLIAGDLSKQSASWEFKSNGVSHRWNSYSFANTGFIGLTYGKPVPFVKSSRDDAELKKAADGFFKSISADIGLQKHALSTISINRKLDYTIVSTQPEINGIPVHGAYAVFSINKNGELALFKARGFGSSIKGSFVIPAKRIEAIGAKNIDAEIIKTENDKIYLPHGKGRSEIYLQAAYRVQLTTKNPALQPILYIDAETGEVLAAENDVRFIDLEGNTEGYCFPLYGAEEEELFPFSNLGMRILDGDSAISDDGAEFTVEIDDQDFPVNLTSRLRGRWVTVREWTGELNEFIDDSSAYHEVEIENDGEEYTLTWNEDNSSPDERCLFYHVNFIHDYWKTLENEFDGLDYPMRAVCGMGGEGVGEMEDNAFSSGLGIYFGRGRRLDNFAHYADVVYHEYTHSVTGVVYAGHNLPYEGQSGALNEAWSDYFPCSITDEPRIGEGGLMGQNRYMRSLDNQLRYPDHWRGEVHADSRIISGAMWDVREQLGAGYCDSLFHFAKYHHARDFQSYLADIFLTDDDDGDLTNGAPNYRVIYEAFFEHGITAVELPLFALKSIEFTDSEQEGVEGNGNNLYEPGEVIGINIEVFRFGMEDENDGNFAYVSFQTEHPGIMPVRDEVLVEGLEIGAYARAAEPLLFEVAEDIEPSFAELELMIATANGEFTPLDTFNIVLGVPSLLLVKDGDDEKDYKRFYDETLLEMDLVYAYHETAAEQVAMDDYLGNFETVIWFTGDAQENILTEDSRSALQAYLDSGRNLLLTGQSAGEAEDSEEFFNEYLGARNTIDSTGQVYAVGVEGDPVGRGMQLLMLVGTGARNQKRAGAVEAIEPAVEIFHYPRMDNQPAGVRFDNPENNSKTVYLPFGLEAVAPSGPMAGRKDVIEAAFDWFNENEAGELPDLTPAVYFLNPAFPNPFNSVSKIKFGTPVAGNVQIGLYDTNGRLMTSAIDRRFSAGSHTVSIDAGSLPSGIYMIQMNAGDYKSARKVALVR